MENESISVYTKAQAIDDGFQISAGRLGGREITLTTTLVAELTKEELLCALITGLRRAGGFIQPDLAEFRVGEKRIWVDDNGREITLMLPEDY
jgi:hypothetical protein